ncbi:MAG: hypothetical protein M9921_07365 [Fimbriimonadaceae bacterium]|nr:hypothetical protein [Fimbriimonadaceae bacterium]
MTLLALLPALILGAAHVDVRVDGDGYLRFVRDGRVAYAKQAVLEARDGKLCHVSGPAILPTIRVPEGAEAISVDLEGRVSCTAAGRTSEVGRLVLALFEGGTAMREVDGLLVSPDRPHVGNPGEGTCGVIRTDGAAATTTTAAPQRTATPAPAYSGKGATIVVRPQTEVSGGAILLGDIADIQAAPELLDSLRQVVLGDTPPMGVPRILDRDRVLTRLRAAKIETADLLLTVPEKAEVRRRSAKVTNAEFIDAAALYARQQLSSEVALESKDEYPEMAVPEGKLELRGTSMTQYGATISVVVAAVVDGKPVRSRTVRFTANLAEAGVRQGSAVKVLLKSGGAVVEVTGTARKTALVGQSVEVEVKLDQRTTHVGVVTAPGVVEVKLS